MRLHSYGGSVITHKLLMGIVGSRWHGFWMRGGGVQILLCLLSFCLFSYLFVSFCVFLSLVVSFRRCFYLFCRFVSIFVYVCICCLLRKAIWIQNMGGHAMFLYFYMLLYVFLWVVYFSRVLYMFVSMFVYLCILLFMLSLFVSVCIVCLLRQTPMHPEPPRIQDPQYIYW